MSTYLNRRRCNFTKSQERNEYITLFVYNKKSRFSFLTQIEITCLAPIKSLFSRNTIENVWPAKQNQNRKKWKSHWSLSPSVLFKFKFVLTHHIASISWYIIFHVKLSYFWIIIAKHIHHFVKALIIDNISCDPIRDVLYVCNTNWCFGLRSDFIKKIKKLFRLNWIVYVYLFDLTVSNKK